MSISGNNKRREFEAEAMPHLDALYGMALRLTRDESDAEDLVQDTLVKAYRFFHRYQPGSNARAWLFKVMVNLFYNDRRKIKKNNKLQTDLADVSPGERLVSEASAGGYRPEEIVLEKLGEPVIRRALEEISYDFRIAVVLCDLYDFTYREIAEILDIPVGTVMSRLYRGRRALRERLYGYAVERGYIRAAPAGEGADLADLDTYRRRRERGR